MTPTDALNQGAPARPARGARSSARLVGVIGYLGAAAFLVLWPSAAVPGHVVTAVTQALTHLGLPRTRALRVAVEFACNVLMTLPAPLILTSLRPAWTWRQWTLAALLASSGVELYQALVLPDQRSATVRDVVANTSGVALGALLLTTIRRRRQPLEAPKMPPDAAEKGD